MNQLVDTIFFADPEREGLDTDTNENYIPKGHSRYRLNCRSGSSGGSVGVVENVKGNTLVAFEFESLEEHTEIGSCDDPVAGHIYYFIAGEVVDDLILRYETITNSITVVCRGDFGFDESNRIYNAKYLDGELVWTDGDNPPRSIIVQNAINNYNGVAAGLDSYAAITEQVLDAIVYPPTFPPTIAYVDDTTRNINNLRGSMWQFAYRYVYVDDHKSCWGPWSKVGKPIGDENVDGRYFEDQTINNCIEVSLWTGTNEVKRIEIATRDSNISPWVLIETIEKYDASGSVVVAHNSTYVYPFYNDFRGEVLPQDDFVRPFDYVPLQAKAIEVMEDERLVVGDYLEGFDNVELDAEIEELTGWVTAESMAPVQLPISYTQGAVSATYDNSANYQLAWALTIPIVPGYATYKIDVYVGDTAITDIGYPAYGNPSGNVSSVFINTTPTTTYLDILNGLVVKLNSLSSLENDFCFRLGNSIKFNVKAKKGIPLYTYPTTYIRVTRSIIPSTFKKTVFKQGAYHQVGVVYYDRANRSGYTNSEDLTIGGSAVKQFYVPFAQQLGAGTTTNQYLYRYHKLKLKHQPPAWATHYQILVSKNQSMAGSLSMFVMCDRIIQSTADDTVRVNINQSITEYKAKFPNTTYGTYEYQKGDRIRFLYRRNVSSTQVTYFNETIDLEILGYDDANTLYTGVIVPNFNPIGNGIPISSNLVGVLVEIYTPSKKKDDQTTFFEVGECFEIGNAGLSTRYHKGGVQNQDPANYSGVPAITSLEEAGDSYIIGRMAYIGSSALNYMCESSDYSDYYSSDSYNTGRVNKVDRDARQRWYFNYYRHGGRKYPMTNLNFLFQFKYDDYDNVSVDNGEITGLRQIGYTLKILQQKKITSQYISRTELVDSQGNTSLQKSDKIFGNKNPSEQDYGCYDAGSIVANDRYVYFYDVAKGCYVRDSANGMEPISMYYMDNFWKDLSISLNINKGKYYIHSIFNKEYGELYITFVPIARQWVGTVPASFTLHYHEPSNRWKSFWSFIPEGYGITNNVMVSWKDGQLWRHEANSLYTNFYGTQYNLKLDLYSNEQPKQVKLYRSLTIHSNRLWYCPNSGDIYILPTENYPNGMVSRLTSNQFDPQEGIFYAGFLNDMGDPRFSTAVEALFGGRELRGRAIKIILTSDGVLQTQLDFVTVNSVISEISN